VLGADLQRQWRDSPQPADPAEPSAPQYGYGIERQILAPNVRLSYQFGEMPGYNGFAGYDPVNQVTIVIWSNLAVGLDGQQTAETLLNRVSDQVYELPPSEPPMPAPSTTR
jgi:D-alanyl-D-alanine carboxypeptidase